MSTTYQYSDLSPGQIRLINISHDKEGNLNCCLEAVHIEATPPFIAMSYCWAGQVPDRSVNVEDGKHFLRITYNVEALLKLMLNWTPRHSIWIDAVCINQEDLSEKNKQVAMMSTIYTRAAHCVIWLGHGNLTIVTAVHALPELVAEARAWASTNGASGPNDEEYAKMEVSDRIRTAWTGLELLMTLPWFRRVWIIQEAVIPEELVMVYGTSEVDLEALSLLTLDYGHYSEQRKKHEDRFKQQEAQVAWENIVKLRHSRHSRVEERKVHSESDRGGELLGLITEAQHSMASHPLDHVYGVLGLACQEWRNSVPVDYSLGVLELYMNVTRLFRAFYDRLEFLTLSSPYKSPEFTTLPSWCPDYSLYARAGVAPLSFPLGLYNRSGYHAGYTRAQWEMDAQGALENNREGLVSARRHRLLSDYVSTINRDTTGVNSRVMYIDGFETDRVVTAIPSPWQAGHMPGHVTEYFELFAWDEQCLQLSKSIFKSETTPTAHWRTMTANIDNDQSKHTKDLSEIYELARIVFSGTYIFPDGVNDFSQLPGFLEHKAEMMVLVSNMSTWTKGRSFFSTVKGRIGLGPGGLGPGCVKEGDMVCVLVDGNTPFILRPSVEEYYIVLGEAYVDGVMEGEALTSAEARGCRTFGLV
jgi:hypothetical protein